MSERLSDEVVGAMSRMPAAACHEQRMYPWDALSALAAEVQDWRNRRCETCALWEPRLTDGVCAGRDYERREADDTCKYWEPRA